MDKEIEIISRYNIRINDSRINMESYDISCAKNDEERVKIALQYLSRYENPIDYSHKSIIQCKSATIASEHIEKGNKAYQSLSWRDSVCQYTKAVSYAEISSKELARAYGNRSAALYECGLYDDSLIDIERALKIGYNDDIKAKLYARRAKCIYALEKKMTPEVIKAIADARKWLEKMNSIKKKLLMNILDEFPKNLSIKKPLTKNNISKLIPKIPNDNPKIPGVSGAITLKYSQEHGRHVVATKDINVGEVIMVQKSYAYIHNNADFYYKYCANCCKDVFAGIPCHQCVNVIYCDENCRDEDWREYHDIECSVISAMIGNVISQNLLTLRLTVKAYKEAGTFEKLQENIRKINEINDPILKLFTNDVFDPTKFASVYSLWKTATISFQDALISALILHSLAATTEIFGKKITTFKQLLKNKWAKFMSGLIMTNHRIISLNGTPGAAYSFYVNPFWCLFNNSCDPSTLSVNYKNVNALIAVQRIKKGEQIFITYGPEFLMFNTNERRNHFKKCEFWCECVACIRNWGPDSHLTFPSYGVSDLLKNPEMGNKMLIISNYNKSEIFLSDIDVKLKMIQHIYDLLNFFQSTHGYPTQEIFALRILLNRIVLSIC
ncbi:hypothetical protein PV328_006407 [Microctonus aethiopoides]|uniref:SET domain-containing protein n=1 Tax=Microctonus aethiopoides TaxID=144406 RepID=A0AA39KTH1_9HYME|nr:hypothetical protein PV328_006407 [Microctonus aethiopoides]